jgi:hypothetical protein
MNNSFIKQCLIILNDDEIKLNIKNILKPVLQPLINLLLKEIYPYIYISLVFVFISFLLHLGIFILLIRNKSII